MPGNNDKINKADEIGQQPKAKQPKPKQAAPREKTSPYASRA